MLFRLLSGDMAFKISFLFILAGLTGVHSKVRVTKVSVNAGKSISIPCLYEPQYKNNVKYLCRGYYWNFCKYAILTNQQNTAKLSISDNKKGVFTVTINSLQDSDSHYWCAVEISNGADVRYYFQLSVTRDTPRLSVVQQELSSFTGHNITINCSHSHTGESKWCRLGGSCVTRSPGSISGTAVTLTSGSHNPYQVTMSGLKTESSGWYLCVKGDLQMPVRLTVTDKPVSSLAPTSAPTSEPTSDPALGPAGQNSVGTEKYLIAVCLLVLIVMVTLFIWFLLKRQRQRKAEQAETTETFRQKVEEELSYSTVGYTRHTAGEGSDAKSDGNVSYSSVVINNKKQQTGAMSSDAKSDGDVTYTSVVITNKKKKTAAMVEGKPEDVLYSSLAQIHKKP